MDKEYLKQVAVYVLVSVLALGLMIYVGYHMVSGFASEVETHPAYLDKFSESVTGDAYILRREKVLYSNTAGTVNYLVSDGGKVALGDELADIYRSGGDGVRERIEEIDRQIEVLLKVEENSKYLSASDAVKIDAEIAELLVSLRRDAEGNSLSSAVSVSERLLSEMQRRLLVTGETESFADEIADLRAERAAAVSEMTDVAETVKSDVSAYYFYDVDGYENAFSFEDIEKIRLSDIERMTAATPEPTNGREAGKIVYDYEWYIAIPTDTASLSYFEVGRSYDIELGADGGVQKMVLKRTVTEEGSDSACLIFSSTVMQSGFEYTRMQPAKINVRTYEGYRVPISAVRVIEYDGVSVEGVYILYGNTVYFRRIEPILSQDGFVLCSANAGKPEEEEDGGYYEFPSLTTEEPVGTEAVPAYETVPYLNLYDLVITSSKELYDGKIVSVK